MSGIRAAVGLLVGDALDIYRDDPAACRMLQDHAERLGEPVRVALAGMAGAGKTTLLNALAGEEIALADPRHRHLEAWYRYGPAPRATAHLASGALRTLRLDRRNGRLVPDLDALAGQDVARLVFECPVDALRSVTLIDTPAPEAAAPADAVLYLMRQAREADLEHLRTLRDAAPLPAGATRILAVLSRADDVGAGRLDALLAARRWAEDQARQGALPGSVLGVVPVAGLLALAARTLHKDEFGALVALAGLERTVRERLLLSADRFVRSDWQEGTGLEGAGLEGTGLEGAGPEGTGQDVMGLAGLGPDLRARLLDRFGPFGIRLACVLIRGGIDRPLPLARELARRSGLAELVEAMSTVFMSQGDQLKACAVLDGVESLIRSRPRAGTIRLAASIERLRATAGGFQDLRLATLVHGGRLPVQPALAAEAGRLLGARGDAPEDRLGLAGATEAELWARALECLGRWRTLADHPLAESATDYRILVRSCEAVLARLSPEPGPALGGGSTRVLLRPEPDAGAVEHAQDQGRAGQH